MPVSSAEGPRRVGRPRALRPADDGSSPREQVLDAAAELFSTQGYAATTTRQIADRAGIRQSSLYYYAPGKDQLLLELLDTSVQPTLARVDEILSMDDAAAALWRLVRLDVRTLRESPHNIGTLYLSPELSAPVFAPFHAARARLAAAYQELAGRVAPAGDAAYLGLCCLQLVELVIQLRRDGVVAPTITADVATACLRVLGLDESKIADAAAGASEATR